MPLGIGPLEIIIVLVIVLIIFGPKRLPDLGRSMGKGMREFKDSVTGNEQGSRRARRRLVGERRAGPRASSPPPRATAALASTSRARRVPRRRPPVQHDDRMSVVDHLGELRSRLFVSLAAFGVAFAFAGWQNERILEIVNQPLPNNLPEPITFGVTEAFTTTLTNSAYAAILIALPVILYELYAFVLPAFSPEERRIATPMLLLVPFLFIGGVVFCYFIVLPPAIDFLLSFNSDQFNTQVRAKDYYSFVTLTMARDGHRLPAPGRDSHRRPRRAHHAEEAAQEPPLRLPGLRGGRGPAADDRPGDDAPRDAPAVPALRAVDRAGGASSAVREPVPEATS